MKTLPTPDQVRASREAQVVLWKYVVDEYIKFPEKNYVENSIVDALQQCKWRAGDVIAWLKARGVYDSMTAYSRGLRGGYFVVFYSPEPMLVFAHDDKKRPVLTISFQDIVNYIAEGKDAVQIPLI